MNHRPHKLLVVITVILIIISFFLTVNKFIINKKDLIKLPAITAQPTPTIKHIKNISYGFSFTIPSSWIQEEWDLKEVANLNSLPDGSIAYQFKTYQDNYQFEVLIWVNRSKIEASRWIKTYLHEEIDPTIVPHDFNQTIGGIDAIRVDQVSKARDKPLTYIFFKKDGYIYELIFENNNNVQFLPAYQKIINSFSFFEIDAAQ